MAAPLKQHLIDPEICIRCYTCEMTCPEQAIEHDEMNVVVDAEKCRFCMDCIPVCPTGSIDNWRVVQTPYSLEEQYSWEELPEQAEIAGGADEAPEAAEDVVARLLAEAHEGAGGRMHAPASASKPTVNLYSLSNPVEAVVQGNWRITSAESDSDVRLIILDFQGRPFPVLEGQTLGIIPPGEDAQGRAHAPRLYSVSSPRDGERPGFHNVSLTVKREEGGVCSNYLCDLKPGERVRVTGPFGSTFLMPNDPEARLLMICTGTGSAPMRAFTMARQRMVGPRPGHMVMFFGARTPQTLPYFGPLKKLPPELLEQHLVFSRLPGRPKEYVQDRMLAEEERVAEMLADPATHIYICGLRGMEAGVDAAFTSIAESVGLSWPALREVMREEGRFHVETY
ncbi:MAG: benzoyl-CoA 2,3-epoxidase subunit BoxA [Alphaproteobacteria bacterium]|nr:MAG: benzoyl-CoA 2,3-epoxidase subunit BoxA [Alphaproteobacteria bacterium]